MTGFADWANLKVEVAFASNPLDVNPVWSDVSKYVSEYSMSRGRQDPYSTFDTGSMSMVLDNRNGQFDPTYTSSPYYGMITPAKRVRVSAEYPPGSGSWFARWDGYVQSWDPEYEGNQGEHVNVTAADAFLFLNLYTYTPTNGVPGEYTGARINRVLDAALPGLPQRLESGRSHIIADAELSDTALSHIQDVAQSEWGQLYVSCDGAVTFEDRYHRDTQDRSTLIQAVFGDSTSDEFLYETIDVTYGDQQLWTSAQITDGLGHNHFYTDAATSLEEYKRIFTLSTLVDTPNEGYDMAAWIVQTSDTAQFWMDITVDPVFNSVAMWATILELEISDLVQVNHRPVSGNVINSVGCIERISETVTADAWEITLGLSPKNLTSADWWTLGVDKLNSSTVLGY